jgi:hypothetical protein
VTADPDRQRILSLGAGVQLTTLALLAVRGELPLPQAAIFADTGWEPAAVYDTIAWLRTELADRIPLHVVRKHHPDGSTANIRADTLAVVRAERLRVATMPVYVKGMTQANPSLLRAARQGRAFVVLPVYAKDYTGRKSMLRRQCTGDYKLAAIYAKTREIVGRKPGLRATTGPQVEMWIGISTEENLKRCKPSTFGWVHNCYPLRELGWTRRHCEEWLWEHYQRRVPKSACIGCPFHDDAYWRDMKLHRPEEWVEAIAFDQAIRHLPGVRGECYLHRSCVPLDEVDLRTPEDKGQLALRLLTADSGDCCPW